MEASFLTLTASKNVSLKIDCQGRLFGWSSAINLAISMYFWLNVVSHLYYNVNEVIGAI